MRKKQNMQINGWEWNKISIYCKPFRSEDAFYDFTYTDNKKLEHDLIRAGKKC